MGYIGGLYTGLKYVGALINNAKEVAELDEHLKKFVETNKQDSVVSIFMMPTRFFTTTSTPTVINFKVGRPKTLNGYEPRNNKLLTYPYCFLTIDCVNDSKIYKYELSGDSTGIHFATFAGMSPNVEVICCPRNYNGSGIEEGSTVGTMNLTEEVVMTGFPQCAFTIDAYRAWLAQKATGEALGLAQSVVGVAAGIATGNVGGAIASAFGAAQQANNMVIESTKGSTTRGNQGSSSLTAIRGKDFYIKSMCVTNNYANIIDDFFDRYGYALERITAPNRSSRPHWNYVQTKDCTIKGSVPADDMKKICSIYDKGITFWKNGSEVGNYRLDNRPQ